MIVIMVFMIVFMRMRVRDFAMRMLVRVGRTRGRQNLVCVIAMMPIVMGMFMDVGNRAMSMGMRVSGHLTSFVAPDAR